uniref:Uncharacterized protein n=1 Tax=Rhizophora mucronata TaxID=61149 RepID=A0A2P2JYV3_RHIMU
MISISMVFDAAELYLTLSVSSHSFIEPQTHMSSIVACNNYNKSNRCSSRKLWKNTKRTICLFCQKPHMEISAKI